MMNKQEYLTKLEKELKSAGVSDCWDIIEEYSEHFEMKTADGYGEEETAAKLGVPEDIAKQFREIKTEYVRNNGQKAIIATGLVSADVVITPLFAFLYAWVVTLGTAALTFLTVGAVMITNAGIGAGVVRVPDMPYGCAMLLGVSLLALAVLSGIGTEYCRLYANQLLKVYIRWHKVMWSGMTGVTPRLSLHPVIHCKKRRIMRTVSLVSLPVFAVTFVLGLITMMLAAGSLEPWHVWGWFQ
jgi:uncharacterized membrane protein